jgi:hypothetical protein
MDNKQVSIIIENKIFLIRGYKVMLDEDIACLYQVETRSVVQAVKRNIDRFPLDFVFQLTDGESESLRSQTVISNASRGGRRYLPYVFTEHGVAMLSSVLRSPRALQMNIFIVRAFIKMRELFSTNKDLAHKMDAFERKQEEQGDQLSAVYSIVKQLENEPIEPKDKIGFSML